MFTQARSLVDVREDPKMTNQTLARPVSPPSQTAIAWLIVRIAFIAGTLDIADNLIYNAFRGITPAMVFRYIASGLIGPTNALYAATAGVLLGVFLHYLIALIWTVIFYAARTRLEILRRRPVLSGLVYGGFVYLVMNFIVVPLSAVPHLHRHIGLAARINAVLAVVLFVGLTVSLLLNRALARRNP